MALPQRSRFAQVTDPIGGLERNRDVTRTNDGSLFPSLPTTQDLAIRGVYGSLAPNFHPTENWGLSGSGIRNPSPMQD